MSGVVIGLRFLAGRYHATGWDHHVNEGVVEWPPSPWRIMRALVAAAYRLPEAPSREDLVGLLSALRGLPVYRMPAASLGHTRHYMPKWKPDEPTLVFDAFAAVGVGLHDPNGELLVGWPDAQLSPEQTALLERILAHMGCLGRAESWIEARLIHGELSVMWNAKPIEDGASATDGARVLALQGESEFEQWRRDNEPSQADGARPSAATAPRDLYEIVTQDTPSLHRGAWSGVPGTRWVTYALDGDPFRVHVRPRHPTFPGATIARYRIVSRVRPRLIEAVSIGDRLRKALMSQSSEDDGLPLPVFSGKDASGAPLRDHGHAYCLPADDDHDGRIDHVLVWAQCRFDERARSAIERVARLWGREGFELKLALVAYGAREDYGGVRGNRERGGVPQLGPARVWESRTPFVLPRHPKRRGGNIVDGPEDQLRRELECLGLPTPVAIEPIDGTDAGVHTPWHRFMLSRREGGGSRGSTQGYGFRVVFAEPVRGPIAVGYGARQGLGQLEALV
jgi:CRISPR-associated protein Csb2